MKRTVGECIEVLEQQFGYDDGQLLDDLLDFISRDRLVYDRCERFLADLIDCKSEPSDDTGSYNEQNDPSVIDQQRRLK